MRGTMRSLLCVFAHPDDESFFSAGTIRRAADAGVRVALCCATRGQRGTTGHPPLATIEALPAVREAELREAARAAGVAELVVLDYEDQHLAEAPPEAIRATLVALVRRTRPQVVVTFDPNGGNLHPDHVAISRFTLDAVTAAADPRALPGCGAPHRADRVVWVGPVAPWEETDRARLAARPGVDFLVDTAAQVAAKAAALAAHRTQRAGIDRLFLARPDRDAVLASETYRLGWGAPPPAVPADDLFAGLA
ncbi:MAG TPA: PIG-L deacetylase family protein [Gemmatimonadales bacterium]|nr:PIG-L deacetylase family protein [Gemmatimonadales bacterium]